MLLRSASPKDTIALLALINEAFNRTTNDSFTEQYFDPSYRHTLVAVEADTIVATATLHYVQKIDRIMGQIEDVVVGTDYRGRGLGRLLVEELLKKAIEKGCYKVILNTADKNVPFYKKMGFLKEEFQMVKRY